MQKPIRTAAKTILFSILFLNKLLKALNGLVSLSVEADSMESGTCYNALSVINGMQNKRNIPIAFTFAFNEGSLISTMAGIAITVNMPIKDINSLRVNNLVLSS